MIILNEDSCGKNASSIEQREQGEVAGGLKLCKLTTEFFGRSYDADLYSYTIRKLALRNLLVV